MYYPSCQHFLPKNSLKIRSKQASVSQAHQKHQENPTTSKTNKPKAKPAHKQDARFAPNCQMLRASNPNCTRKGNSHGKRGHNSIAPCCPVLQATGPGRHVFRGKFLKPARNAPPRDPSTTETHHAKGPGLRIPAAYISHRQSNMSQPCLKQRKHWPSNFCKPLTDTLTNNGSNIQQRSPVDTKPFK